MESRPAGAVKLELPVTGKSPTMSMLRVPDWVMAAVCEAWTVNEVTATSVSINMAVLLVLVRMTSSLVPGTPDGDQLPAVLYELEPPTQVLVVAAAGAAPNNRPSTVIHLASRRIPRRKSAQRRPA